MEDNQELSTLKELFSRAYNIGYSIGDLYSLVKFIGESFCFGNLIECDPDEIGKYFNVIGEALESIHEKQLSLGSDLESLSMKCD